MTRVLFAVLVVATFCSQIHAQAFPNDNDGLLDVGEALGFPAFPRAPRDFLALHSRGIEDLDGTKLLTNLETLFLHGNNITSIESGAFAGLINLEVLQLTSNDLSELNLTGATFNNLSAAYRGGIFWDSNEITRLYWMTRSYHKSHAG